MPGLSDSILFFLTMQIISVLTAVFWGKGKTNVALRPEFNQVNVD